MVSTTKPAGCLGTRRSSGELGKLARALLLASMASMACSEQPAPPPADPASPIAVAAQDEELHGLDVPDDAPPGRWRVARDAAEQEIAELESIGYASGYEVAPVESGVVVRDPRACAGLNLYVSGHGPEAILMDMEGRELHRWHCSYATALPDFHARAGSRASYRDFFRRAFVYPNGDLLAIFEGLVLIKLDRDSKLLWTYDGSPHHDLQVMDDGSLYVLGRKGHVIPRLGSKKAVLEDFVEVLGPDGKLQRRVSILECFEHSEYAQLLERTELVGDFFHTNSLEVLDGRFADRHAAFAKGNVLVSILRLDTLAILDLERKEVVWALTEGWSRQHCATFLDDGHMLLFDNLGGDEPGGRSRVLEIDPVAYRPIWSYEGDVDTPFQSDTCGTCQRLPNGNTLVTESDNGRAFEVTREGEIVWEFLNPNRAGDDAKLIATLFEVLRLPPDFPVDWARGGGF